MNLHEISLKWNGFQSNIVTNVKDLYQDEGLSDVTLVSDGFSFKAHKVILSACSPLFRGIFRQNPNKDPIIVLHDVNTDSLKSLLTFMYSGEVNVTEEFLPVLLKAADSLKIRGLSTAAENSIEKKTQSPPKKRKKWDHWPIIEEKKLATKKTLMRNFDKDEVSVDSELPIVIPKVEIVEPLYIQDKRRDSASIIDSENSSSPLSAHSPFTQRDNVESIMSDNAPFPSIDESTHCLTPSPIIEADNNYKKEGSNEIEKEIETVLQSDAPVESLNCSTAKFNGSDPHVNETKLTNNIAASYANPVFPCPFCKRTYNSWGYRRRHVKSRHETNRLPCKVCLTLHSNQAAWYAHTTRMHGISHEDARNSLVVMVEAHAVLTLAEPSLPALLGQVRIAPTDSTTAAINGNPNSNCIKNRVLENAK